MAAASAPSAAAPIPHCRVALEALNLTCSSSIRGAASMLLRIAKEYSHSAAGQTTEDLKWTQIELT